jgi:alanine racemase
VTRDLMASISDSEILFPGAELEIDLDALVRNWKKMRDTAGPANCGATVKADAYGLGVDRVAPALWDAGCRTFFVATPREGVQLRGILADAEIFVFNGAPAGTERYFHELDLVPVLNSLDEIAGWAEFSRAMGAVPCPAAIHFDTGMNRLGLSPEETEVLIKEPARASFPVRLVMSHLASADMTGHETTPDQRDRFADRTARFIKAWLTLGLGELPRRSLANSAGVLTGEDYHFDMVRPGIGLYGANPFVDQPNPMSNVIRLRGRVMQIRDISPPDSVGYGGTYAVTGPARIATVDVGYADGFLRAFGNERMDAVINGHKVPIVGRVSMDSHALDITALPLDACTVGAMVDLLGGPVSLDDAIKETDLSGYELLTLLGRRYNRAYKIAGEKA